MKLTPKQSRDRNAGRERIAAAAGAVVAMTICIGTSAETVPRATPAPEATLPMCATTAFRNKNINICDELERRAKVRVSNNSAIPGGAVPSTSPNYNKDSK